MSTRESNDSTSQSGKSYVAGSGATVKNITMSKDLEKSVQSVAAKNATHVIEVHADNAVYDTVSGTFLFPGRDFNPGDLQRK